MEKECYEEEVQPYRKTDYKPIIIYNRYIIFYRYAYNIDILCTMKLAVSKITRNELTYDQLALVKNLKTFLDFRSGYINIDGFIIIIRYI